MEVISENKISVQNLKPLKLIDTGIRLPADNSFFRFFSLAKTMSYDPHQTTVFTNTKNRPSVIGKPRQPRGVPIVLPVEKAQHESNQLKTPICFDCGRHPPRHPVKPLDSFKPNMVNLGEYTEKCKDQAFSEQYPSLCKEVNGFDIWRGFFSQGRTSAEPSRHYQDRFVVNRQEKSQTTDSNEIICPWCGFASPKEQATSDLPQPHKQIENNIDMSSVDPKQCKNNKTYASSHPACSFLHTHASGSLLKNVDTNIDLQKTPADSFKISRPVIPNRSRFLPRVFPNEEQQSESNGLSFEQYAKQCKDREFFKKHTEFCKALGYFPPKGASYSPAKPFMNSNQEIDENNLFGVFRPDPTLPDLLPMKFVSHSNAEEKLQPNKVSDAEENLIWEFFFPPKAYAEGTKNSRPVISKESNFYARASQLRTLN